jgi:hypothetical protein
MILYHGSIITVKSPMTPEKLSALLAILNPAVVQLIMDNRKLTSIEATTLFYNSALYAMLENEASKLWHLSPLTLYDKQVMQLFCKYKILDYIVQCYGALHTTGPEYIIEDIAGLIEELRRKEGQ